MKRYAVFLIVAIVAAALFSQTIEDFYDWLYYEGEGNLVELYNNLDYLKVINEGSKKADDLSKFLVGMSYMNMLFMEKAVEYLSEVGGKYEKTADFYKMRSEVILKKDKSLAKEYLSMLGNSLAERAEADFIRYVVFGEDTSEDLGEIFKKAIELYKKDKIGYVDMYAFDYAYTLRNKDIDKAIVVLNKAVTYNFNINDVEIYYSASDLRQSHFAVLALLSLLLREKAVKEIEDLFGMELESFLSLSQIKRDKMLNDMLISEESSKKIRFINYLLLYSLNVLVYGRNDYYGLMHFDAKPFIYTGTIKEEQDFTRKLLGIMKTS